MAKFFAFILFLFVFLFPIPYTLFPTYAHAFGQIYTLPLPVWLYLYGGGAVVVVSFLLIGYFTKNRERLDFPQKELKIPFLKILTSDFMIFILKALGLLFFFLTILTGFFGNDLAYQNFAPVFFWIIALLGLTYLSAIFGNFWKILNPWMVILSWFSKTKAVLAYPKKLGYLPALVFYFVLIWLELLSQGQGSAPQFLARAILIYTSLTFLGHILYGMDWFKYGEFFSVFFGLISKISPLQMKQKKLYLKPPFVGLLEVQIRHWSLLVFILFMLSSTAFDGFRSTSVWVRVYINYLYYFEPISGIFALVLTLLIFLACYILAVTLMKMLVKTKLNLVSLLLEFAPTLIPIALAYNIAHYYTLLLIQGQSIIPLLSDPFNLGWNLFGTANYSVNVGILKANFIWHSEVVVIIVGHIAAVYLAHLISLKQFSSQKQAVISQIPMLLLMVLYTITGLWILSQPLTLGS